MFAKETRRTKYRNLIFWDLETHFFIQVMTHSIYYFILKIILRYWIFYFTSSLKDGLYDVVFAKRWGNCIWIFSTQEIILSEELCFNNHSTKPRKKHCNRATVRKHIKTKDVRVFWRKFFFQGSRLFLTKVRFILHIWYTFYLSDFPFCIWYL